MKFTPVNSQFYETGQFMLSEWEYQALKDLYDSTNGPGWKYSDNWLTGPVSAWRGITVTGDRVTSIILEANKLKGIIPSSFGKLTARTILDL